jgi:predicted site-specific integrase-resolvase
MNGTDATEYITINKAVSICGLSPQTIRKLGDTEKIQCFKTPSGHRRFNKHDLEAFCTSGAPHKKAPKSKRVDYLYTRVSSKKQLDDLSRQVEYLQSRKPEYASYTSLSDIGSGINFKRKGLQTLLDSCVQRTIGEVIVAHRDRLSRFGFDLLQLIIEKSGGKVIVLDDEENKSTEQELAEDLLSIVHIYSCKQMGKRSYRSKQTKESKNQDETEQQSEDNH